MSLAFIKINTCTIIFVLESLQCQISPLCFVLRTIIFRRLMFDVSVEQVVMENISEKQMVFKD